MTWNSKGLVTTARIILGVIMLAFGVNGFWSFLPSFGPGTEAAGAVFAALGGTGYFFPVLKVFEILIGLMLIFNKYTPLAIVMLTPISLSIVIFHLALAPLGNFFAYLVGLLNLYFIFVYKNKYAVLMES